MNCTYHSQNQIALICIAPHKCQRKLCFDCLLEHNVDLKFVVTVDKFEQMVTNKVFEEKCIWEKEQSKYRIALKSLLYQTEIMIKKIREDTLESIQDLNEMIEQENTLCTSSIKEDYHLIESSQNDLDNLIQILEGKNQMDWNAQKNLYILKIDEVRKQLDQKIHVLSENFSKKVTEIMSILSIQKEEPSQEQECTQEIVGDYWDYSVNPPLQRTKKLSIVFTKNQEIQYLQDGQIIRIDSTNGVSKKEPEILTNLEQIKYLQWSGNYGVNNQKVGKWIAKWNGEIIMKVGGEYSEIKLTYLNNVYLEDGKKQGKWREIIKNYTNKAQIFEEGEYVSDQKNGMWKYIYQNEEIAGGKYDKQGIKNGKWIELSQGYSQYSQVTFNGEYKNGKKIGKWEILLNYFQQGPYINIGGGSYDEEGDGHKIGIWIDLDERFSSSNPLTYEGEYKNGKKVGKWEIWFKQSHLEPQIQIVYLCSGGGSYDEGDDGHKIGMWIDLDERFSSSNPLTIEGEYKNGKKVGRWDIKNDGEYVGGGLYDECDGHKIGKWVDLDEKFQDSIQVTNNGEYKNGKKVGRWDILIMSTESQKTEQIGGGSYDASGNGLKIGKWVDLDDGFYDNKQVTYNGEYKNGQKVGRWEIWYQELFSNNQQIGGGSYDASGNGIKIGKWVDLDDGFCCDKQVTYNGEYKNGDKVGRWEIYYRAPYGEIQLIGGGSYDDRDYGIKTGDWVGISEKFLDTSQVTYNGQYKNGYKVGLRAMNHFLQCNRYHINGGGSYDQNCLEVKIGKWTQLDNWFDYLKQVTYNGVYLNGKKVGKWVEIDIKKNKKKNETNYNI